MYGPEKSSVWLLLVQGHPLVPYHVTEPKELLSGCSCHMSDWFAPGKVQNEGFLDPLPAQGLSEQPRVLYQGLACIEGLGRKAPVAFSS